MRGGGVMSLRFEKNLRARSPGPPPIKPTPGDLRMMFQVALEDLARIERECPDDFTDVCTNASSMVVALRHWIDLALQAVPDSEKGKWN